MTEEIQTHFLAIVLIVSGMCLGLLISGNSDESVSVLVAGMVTLACYSVLLREKEDRRYVLRIWGVALGLRVLVACVTYFFDLRGYIAPDYDTYDALGNIVYQSWVGLADPNDPYIVSFTSYWRSGWGMYYYVAGLYLLIGQNPFAIQLLNCVFGAAVSVLIYHIAYLVYPQRRVARMAGMITALSPSMVIWSSQGIKESPIVLCLCLCLFLTLKLTQEFRWRLAVLLFLSLFGLYSLRHYVAYVVFCAIATSLIVAGRHISVQRILQGGALVIVLGVVFASFGGGEVADTFSLKKIQAGREWSARASGSGYGGNVDITDTRQALLYLPLGTLYFLYAPFPWMVRNLSQLLTLPELILWWLAAPFLFKGYWFAVRRRLRSSFAICVFTLGLTMVYALYQTNAGTAHRTRVQLLGFFVIFVSIGLELRRVAKSRERASQIAWLRQTGTLVPVHTHRYIREEH